MRTPTKVTTCIQDLALTNCQQDPVQDTLSKQKQDKKQKTNKQKTKSSVDRITTSYSPVHQRGKKTTTHLLPPEHKHKSHPTLCKPLDQPSPKRAETKRKKEYNLEAGYGEINKMASDSLVPQSQALLPHLL